MADYAGAVAALKAAFVTSWSTTTPIAYANEPKDTVWPPNDGSGQPLPWVYFEVIGSGSRERGIGKIGDKIWLYLGNIHVHVFVPKDYGTDDAHALAVQAGEIFRAQTFYNDGLGAKVICGSPSTDGGASDADNGDWFRLTCTVPFEYYHRG